MPSNFQSENGHKKGVGKNLYEWVGMSIIIWNNQPRVDQRARRKIKNIIKKIMANTSKLCVKLYNKLVSLKINKVSGLAGSISAGLKSATLKFPEIARNAIQANSGVNAKTSGKTPQNAVNQTFIGFFFLKFIILARAAAHSPWENTSINL